MFTQRSNSQKQKPVRQESRRRTDHAPAPGPVPALLRLRHAAGNRASGQLLQAKLRVSQPDDLFEQEADRVADHVMRMPDPARSAPPTVGRRAAGENLQRSCARQAGGGGGSGGGGGGCECEQCGGHGEHGTKDELQLQARAAPGQNARGGQSVEDSVAALRGGGEPLSESVRAFFEPRIGYDFGAVRVHTGARAAEAARAAGALAFTVGRDIVFGAGQYSPETSSGGHLLAHELTHSAQQGAASAANASAGSVHGAQRVAAHDGGPSPAPEAISRTHDARVQRRTARDEEEFAEVLDADHAPAQARVTTPNPTASAPPTPTPLPGAGSFAPLTGSALTDRQTHGLSTDTGPMVAELESELYPTGGSHPACVAHPANFRTTLAGALSTALRADMPTLTPTAAPDPMTIAAQTATEAMPIITSHYSPHAPSRSAASFMALVSRKLTTFGNPIRTTTADFAEFLSWYAGATPSVRTLVVDKCNIDQPFWDSFVTWLNGPGASWNANPHNIRARSALYDTYLTSVTQGGRIQFGRGFRLSSIPHTVVHEAMHLFQHADLEAQVGLMQGERTSTDIITEGFAEYLARGVRDQVITAIQGHTPPVLSPADATTARTHQVYPGYFAKAVALRDILYRHGQDGEESIRRAFFLGEGWRFGLRETAAGGSPIETDRALPAPLDVRFDAGGDVPTNPAVLDPIVAYVKTRNIATVEVIGRTSTVGTDADNLLLGQRRADNVKAYLVGQGIDASRIAATSRGEADQIAGGTAVNRRATVTIRDPRNEFPGLPATGRP